MQPHLSGTGLNSEVFSFDSSSLYYSLVPSLLSVIFITNSRGSVAIGTGGPGTKCVGEAAILGRLTFEG